MGHRDQGQGLICTVGGGLVGAWLGFDATGGFVGVDTAIVGAGAGVNLVVRAFDIARSAPPRPAPPQPTGKPELASA